MTPPVRKFSHISDVTSPRHAFSLVELLVVLAIVTALIGATAPSFTSILMGTGVDAAAGQMAGAFEQAHALAITNHSYVYVAMNQVNSNTLMLAIADSPSGDSDIKSASAIVRIAKLMNVTLMDSSNVRGLVSLPDAATNADSITNSKIGSLTLQLGGTSVQCDYVVRIAPSGQAFTNSTGISRYIQVGLAPAHRPNSKDLALIQMTGLTGNVSIFQP